MELKRAVQYLSKFRKFIFVFVCVNTCFNLACDEPPPNNPTAPYPCLVNAKVEPGMKLLTTTIIEPDSNTVIHLLEKGVNYANHFKFNTSPAETDMNYFLFTRSNRYKAHLLFPNVPELLQKSSFNPTLSTKVIIHGFYDNLYINKWMQKMKNAFLAELDYNVILVDWSSHNGFPLDSALRNMPSVAQGVANLILFLVRTTACLPQSFHIVAHGLGTQVIALSGRIVRNIGRITALDPFGPDVDESTTSPQSTGYQELNPSDALFVDVIHTNIATNKENSAVVPMGHVDFYPNGGRFQPGCENKFVNFDPLGLTPGALNYLTCDHFRACDYFTDSIFPTSKCASIGVNCLDWEEYLTGMCADCSDPGNCIPMGHTSEKNTAGKSDNQNKKYYLITSPNPPPFCVFQHHFMVHALCPSNECPEFFNLQNGVSLGFISMNILSNKETSQMVFLNTTIPRMISGGRFVYVVSSATPIDSVAIASVRWNGPVYPDNPNAITSFGISFDRISIYSIPQSGNSINGQTVINLCAAQGQNIEPQKPIDMSPQYC